MHSLTFRPVRICNPSFPLSHATTREALRRVAARTIRLARFAGHEVYTIIPGRVWDIEPSGQSCPISGTLTLAAV